MGKSAMGMARTVAARSTPNEPHRIGCRKAMSHPPGGGPRRSRPAGCRSPRPGAGIAGSRITAIIEATVVRAWIAYAAG